MSVPRVSDFQAVTDAIKTLTAAIYECERAGEPEYRLIKMRLLLGALMAEQRAANPLLDDLVRKRLGDWYRGGENDQAGEGDRVR